MKFASINEILAVPPTATRSATPTQSSGQPTQSFGESLLAVSKASSNTGASRGDGAKSSRRQKSESEDAQQLSTVAQTIDPPLPIPSPQTLHLQVPVTQNLSSVDSVRPALIPVRMPPQPLIASPPASITPAVASPLGIESTLARPAIVQAATTSSNQAKPNNNPLQIASLLPMPTLPDTQASVTLVSQTATDLPDTVTGPAQKAASTTALDGALRAVSSAITSLLPVAVENAGPNWVSHAAPITTNKDQSSSSSVAANVGSNGPVNVIPLPVKEVVPDVNPIPVAHAAINVPAKETSASLVPTNPQPPAQDPTATGLLIPVTTADQMTALVQLTAIPHINGQSKESNSFAAKSLAATGIQSKDNTVSNEAAGVKPHASFPSDQPGTQKGSQDTSTSSDQSQSSASFQKPTAEPVQMSFANHTVAVTDHSASPSIVAPTQPAPTLAGAPGHTPRATETTLPIAPPPPQALPAINTARLIQTMGQSEMRIGMRSNDFGNISISTSASRDVISAQISLDHSELARTLTAHIPEMQTRFGGKELMDVRIDMNGQSAGTPPGMSQGSAGEPRSDRQQKSSAPPGHAVNGFTEPSRTVAAVVAPAILSRLNARLDITA